MRPSSPSRHGFLALLVCGGLVVAPIAVGCSAGNGDKGGGGSLTGDPSTGDGTDAGDGFKFDSDPGGGLGDIGTGGPALDPKADNDGDGYAYADDCDDRNPLINPGAYDVPGDGTDNDCNGTVDDKDDCDTGLSLTSGTAMDFAKSLGLCRTADPAATGKAKTWGVLSATLATTDGVGKPVAHQYGIESKWGSAISPKAGGSMAVLSTGSARTPGQSGYIKPLQLNFGDPNTGNENVPPSGWPKNSSGCPAPLSDKVNDSVALKLKIRVPTNAKAFTYDFDFYTSEYITYVCTEFNDTYVAILKSKAPLDAKNLGNISVDKTGNPVNVNSGFFEVCSPGTSSGGKSFACALGRGELAGTGFEGDGSNDGATSWLETKADVVAGEEMEIDFIIWNTSDHILQSTVLLDNWQWAAEPTTGSPVTDRPPR